MMSRRFLIALVAVLGAAGPVSAQLFGVVFDPTNYANALLRYAQLQQQYAQLVATYQQIRTQYVLLQQQAQLLPVNMTIRYRSLASPWLPLAASTTFGTTTSWIQAANTGSGAAIAYGSATEPLLSYAGAINQLSAGEAARVRTRYDRVQLADGSVAHGLEALGILRGHQQSMETTMRNLEDDAYADDAGRNTQIAVLNKLNATAVTSARLAKDANNLMISLLEQELLDTTDRREAAAETINAHIAFLHDAPPLLARTTAQTTTALTTFRIP
jgi:hypothetical protein